MLDQEVLEEDDRKNDAVSGVVEPSGIPLLDALREYQFPVDGVDRPEGDGNKRADRKRQSVED